MTRSAGDEVTFIYLEKPLAETSMEEVLLKKVSRETFCPDHSPITIVSEKPGNTTIKKILEKSDSPLVAISLNDTVCYSENWLKPLKEALEREFELVSPVCGDVFEVDMPYFSPLTFNDVAALMMEKHAGSYVRNSKIPPLAYVLRTESLLKLPLEAKLDEIPVLLKSALVPSSLVHRFGDYFAFRRDDILPLIPHGIGKVLDVGCAKGLTGELIKKERGCKVFGAEINKNAARIAMEKLDKVFCVDIEKSDLPFDGDLDVIIFADIIEHLFDPWRVLKNARKWLKPDGIVIASIPNTGHYSIILDLLRGRWDYVPFGLLCISHIRFFTRASIENMFTKSGYFIEEMRPQDFPLHLKEQVSTMLKKYIRLENISEDIFYHGYYVVAKQMKPF